MSTARQLYGIAIPLAVSMVVTSGLFFTLNSASLADRPAKQTSDPAEGSGDHQTTTQPISEAVELPSKTVPSERRRQQVRQLIQSLLPDREIAGLDIWVDQFADLPDDEIRFMVTQSSILQSDSLLPAMSGQKEDVSFGSQPMLHFDSPSRAFPGRSSENRHDNTGQGDAAFRVALQNLRSTMIVGHREQLRLHISSAGQVAELTPMTVHSMAAGEIVSTGNPLHVAIRTDGPVFFLLDNGQLTRNGLFQRNESGQLGLQLGGDFLPLNASPLVSDSADWRIDRDGQVVLKSDSTVLGRIATVQVADPAQLKTEDGVYFRTNSATTEPEQIELRQGELELSNVDVSRNRNLIDAR